MGSELVRRLGEALDADEGVRWNRKQELAAPSRFYGDGGTIHSSGELDVEVCNGKVVSVWFRCQVLPFKQTDVNHDREAEMKYSKPPRLTGVEVLDNDDS